MVEVTFRDQRTAPSVYSSATSWDRSVDNYYRIKDGEDVVAEHPVEVVLGVCAIPAADAKLPEPPKGGWLPGAKGGPGVHECYDLTPLDEPIFVLRSRDPLARFLVRLWVTLRSLFREPTDSECAKQAHGLHIADAMEKYQDECYPHVPNPSGTAASLMAAVEQMAHAAAGASMRGVGGGEAGDTAVRTGDGQPGNPSLTDLGRPLPPGTYTGEFEVIAVAESENIPRDYWVDARHTDKSRERIKMRVPEPDVFKVGKRYALKVQPLD